MSKVLGALTLALIFGSLGALFDFFEQKLIQGWLLTQQGVWVPFLTSLLKGAYALGVISIIPFFIIDLVLWFIVFLFLAGILALLK